MRSTDEVTVNANMPLKLPRSIMRFGLPLASALAPAVAAILFVLVAFGRSLLGFTPMWTDEIDYWREINTFGHVGFAGGYYAINEVPAPAAFSHFGAHGAAFPMLFGPVAGLLGWGNASGPLLNLACITGALLLYFWLVRLNTEHTILAVLSILVFWPVQLYIPSTLEETLHQALAVLLAGIFYVLIVKRDQAPTRIFVGGIVALSIASLLRPTWAPLFLPLFLFRAKTITWRHALWATAGAVPCVVVSFAANVWLSSPYPNFLATLLQATHQSPWIGAGLFLGHLWGNVKQLLLHGKPLERNLRYQVMGVLALALGLLAYGIYRTRRDAGKHGTLDTLSLFHVFNIMPVLALTLAFYDVYDWRDFRVFAPHVLLAVMISIPFVQRALPRQVLSRRVFVFAPLVLNLLLAVSFVPTYQSFHWAHFAPAARPQTTLAGLIAYQPGADPWRNTVLVDSANDTAEILQLPPGIGVSVILAPGELKQPVKSRYLLVSDATMKLLGNPPGWTLLGTTPTGKLYAYTGNGP